MLLIYLILKITITMIAGPIFNFSYLIVFVSIRMEHEDSKKDRENI